MDVKFNRTEPSDCPSMSNVRCLIGKQQRVAGQTRPDISFGANILAGVTVDTANFDSMLKSEQIESQTEVPLGYLSYFL